MFSPDVEWVDIDAAQWQNLWMLLCGPHRQPAYLYGLLEGGVPVALVHSRRGQLDLAHWPADAATLQDAAARLRAWAGVDQVIIVERDDLRRLWDEQQRTCRPDDDLGTFAHRMGGLTDRLLRERAICDPATAVLPEYPRAQYAAMFELLRRSAGPRGSFVLGVFAADRLWLSLAGRLAGDQIVTLTTSQGLADPGLVPPPGVWRQTYRWLLDRCRERLGPPCVGVFLDIDTARRLPFAQDPQMLLLAAARDGSAIIDPWPSSLPRL